MGLKWLFFSNLPTSLMIRNMCLVQNGCQIHIEVIVTSSFGDGMNILFIIKVEILMLIKWSDKSLQLCGLLSP